MQIKTSINNKHTKIILIMVFLLYGFFFFAQLPEHKSFGIKGGITFTTLAGETVTNKENMVGITAGILAVLPITKTWQFQSELLYASKGATIIDDGELIADSIKIRFHYAQLPLLMRLQVDENLSFHSGIYIAYLAKTTIISNSSIQEKEVSRYLHRWDYGISGGLEYEISPISFGARFDFGLVILGKKQRLEDTTLRIPNATHRVASIYTTLRL